MQKFLPVPSKVSEENKSERKKKQNLIKILQESTKQLCVSKQIHSINNEKFNLKEKTEKKRRQQEAQQTDKLYCLRREITF